ncbi:MAG TPA: hypothetical protein VJY63_08270 [Marinospirillum sp.]|uniref:hypothetical protein n=1 Tax=Marinospirillum sp. TaxID=2183934 RepID=UPI002B468178|nr:hypothetical protein [Marinospirillum sp.]HKM15900.1 hypothetical protein [Marinospirillum sp.]
MQLSAQQRYATLQVMGTRLWVPRVHLQGAAPSVACDWPAPAKPISARERLLHQQHQQNQEHQQSQQPPVALPVTVQTVEQPAVAQPLQPLQATVWLLANGWQLVMENTDHQPGLQEADIKLLHNLLMALYPDGLGIVAQQVFNWPLLGVPVAVGDEGELSMTLHAFLTGARVQGVQLAGCLVFGERLFRLMEKSTSMPRLFASPSLFELQQDALRKQAFWQQAGNSGLRAAFASSPVVL